MLKHHELFVIRPIAITDSHDKEDPFFIIRIDEGGCVNKPENKCFHSLQISSKLWSRRAAGVDLERAFFTIITICSPKSVLLRLCRLGLRN